MVSGRLHSSLSQQTSRSPIFSPVFLSSSAMVTFMGAISPANSPRKNSVSVAGTGG